MVSHDLNLPGLSLAAIALVCLLIQPVGLHHVTRRGRMRWMDAKAAGSGGEDARVVLEKDFVWWRGLAGMLRSEASLTYVLQCKLESCLDVLHGAK